MKVERNSEKVKIWMLRNKQSQKYVANAIGITRQTLSKRMVDNSFTNEELFKLKSIGVQL